MWMLVFFLLPLLGLAYVGWHLWDLIPLAPAWRWGAVVLLVGSFLLLFLDLNRTIDRLPLPLARLTYDVGTSSIFVLLYLFIFFAVMDLGRLLHIVRWEWLHECFATTALLAAGLFCLFLGGNMHYRNKARQELTLTTDKHIGADLRVVMLSDLHLGYHNPRKELARWVDMINAEKPDLILIAGDVIDISVRPLLEEDMASEMRRLQAPVYACLGNHEYYTGTPEAQDFFRAAGVNLLIDQTASFRGLTLVGRDDRTNPRRKPLRQLMAAADSTYTIVLDHQPYHLEEAEQAGADFQLSGHTHHGQVWPISWITERIYECAFGQWQRGRTAYYVSSGLGIWGGKFRIGTRSEYVVATIEGR